MNEFHFKTFPQSRLRDFFYFVIMQQGAIGVFDSGYGGLTVLKSLVQVLPEYDFIYLGDNARAPYGTRSFDTVYRYTKSCVEWFFQQGCPLVILACNTASAKALRTIQQQDLPNHDSYKRVLGVIRPTAEIIGKYSQSGHIGILATPGTVASDSYVMEIGKFFPGVAITQHACPLWVPLIENNQYNNGGADYFIKEDIDQLISQDPAIDAVLLGCTHYPIIAAKIKTFLPPQIQLISQGDIVAESLKDYLERHPDMQQRISKKGSRTFYTTDNPADFEAHAPVFYGTPLQAHRATVGIG
jgi:glutamate racemase